jgi:hypothetical protein
MLVKKITKRLNVQVDLRITSKLVSLKVKRVALRLMK